MANFVRPPGLGVQPVPGGPAPSASQYGVPGLALSTPAGFPGSAGASAGALLAQLGPGAVRVHAGFPSQEIVSQPHVVRPLKGTRYQERIGRGQLLFCRRGTTDDTVSTIVTLPQINAVLARAYTLARTSGALERAGGRRAIAAAGGGAAGAADADLFDDTRNAVEQVLEDDLDRQRRMLAAGVSAAAKAENTVDRLMNTNTRSHTRDPELRTALFAGDDAMSHLAYLSQGGVTELWNVIGVSRNIEYARATFKMVNVIQKGPYDVDNVWGSDLQQGAYVYVVLARHRNEATGEYEQFEYAPWAQRFTSDAARASNVYTKYPPLDVRTYEDVAGYTQRGLAYTVGKVGRMPFVQGRRLGSAGAIAHSVDARARLLAGLAHGEPDTEMAAWAETSRNGKHTVHLTIGTDAHDTGVV